MTVFMVAGLGYGDEGKGSVVDYLARVYGAKLIVRYTGSVQAGHNVVTPDGRHHTFSQFGSGMFVPGVKTFLSRFMAINPLNMVKEEAHLHQMGVPDAFSRTFIDGECPIIAPFQIALNRLLELSRGGKRNGSCGMGVGATVEQYREYGSRMLLAKDLADKRTTLEKLEFIRQICRRGIFDIMHEIPRRNIQAETELLVLDDAEASGILYARYAEFLKKANIVSSSVLKELLAEVPVAAFEGSQGMLLDEGYGFWPHVTKSNVTFYNAYALLEEADYQGQVRTIGVLRGYATRHGAGPFPTEDRSLYNYLQEPHNTTGDWQGVFRPGHFDMMATNYALRTLGGVDSIVLTCTDKISAMPGLKICKAYAVANGQYWREVPIMHPNDLKLRAALTQDMNRAIPVFNRFETVGSYINHLITQLPAPVSILSFGPTAEDKIELQSL